MLIQGPTRLTSARLEAPADRRLALAEAGELPYAGAGGIAVGTDLGVDEVGPPGRDARPHGLPKIGGAVDAHAVDAGRACHGGEVRIVRRPGVRMLEVGCKLAAIEVAALQPADRSVGVVVPYHPDHRDGVFDRGPENARVHEESAVAAH